MCADGSEISTHALVTGLEVLRPAANVVVVTVVEEADPTLVTGTGFASGTMSPQSFDAMQVERNADAVTLLADAVAAVGVADADTRVLSGDPGEAVCTFATEVGAASDRDRYSRPRRIQAGVARFGFRLRRPQRAVPGRRHRRARRHSD